MAASMLMLQESTMGYTAFFTNDDQGKALALKRLKERVELFKSKGYSKDAESLAIQCIDFAPCQHEIIEDWGQDRGKACPFPDVLTIDDLENEGEQDENKMDEEPPRSAHYQYIRFSQAPIDDPKVKMVSKMTAERWEEHRKEYEQRRQAELNAQVEIRLKNLSAQNL